MFYVFHGNDTFSQNEKLQNLISKLGDASMLELNSAWFAGNHVRFAELRQACNAVPFLAPARLVICRGIFAKMPAKDFVDDLLDYLPNLPDTTRLIFLEDKKLAKNHRLIKLAEKVENGYVKHFATLEGNQLTRWIQQRVQEKGGDIEPRASHMLATNIGGDLQILDTEIEKLTLYKGDKGTITTEDVALLSPYSAETNIFDLVDALGSRKERQAAGLMHQKLSEGVDPFLLFSMIVRQFRLLIQVKALAEKGMSAAPIAKELKLHSFVAGKIYQQSQQFSLEQLKRIYRYLLETDVGVKTGKNDMVTALYLLIAGIT